MPSLLALLLFTPSAGSGQSEADSRWKALSPAGAVNVGGTYERQEGWATAVRSTRALQEELGLKDDEHFRRAYLQPALAAGLVEMTIPDKPRSSKQRYRLTDAGRKARKKVRR